MMVPVGPATLSGRVTSASSGRGIRNVAITISGGDLANPIPARTGPFGYYSFAGLTTGQDYTITIAAKSYVFTPSTRSLALQSSSTTLNWTSALVP